MFEFLVETYVPQGSTASTPSAADVSLAAEELTRAGTHVRLLRAILVPEEEICFYLYEAQSIDAVRQAASLAGLHYQRVSEASSDTTANARRATTGNGVVRPDESSRQ